MVRKTNSINAIALIVVLLIFGDSISGQFTTHDYQVTSSVIANPERGWYDDYYSHSGSSNLGTTYRSLKAQDLVKNREEDNITLILRLFYLHDFLEKNEVSQEYLALMQSDFDSIRSAGVKCIIRFAYSASQSASVWDATPEKVFSHIASLKNVLSSNSDIIAGVQAGFIGAWGEWYYTKNFAGPGFKPAETDQQNRIKLVESLLEILPDHVTVQGRTPAIMKNLAKTDTPITEAEAFSGSFKSRIGHHNDCFVANNTDYGTYTNLAEDLAYLHETTKYTITGGETCDASNNTSNCLNSVPRMAELHWTYLNRDYNKAVYDKWIDQGCYEEVNISMGYRIHLISAILPDSANPGEPANLSFTFSNTGYAAPTQFKPVQIVLTHLASGHRTILEYAGTNDDIRFWLPGEIHSEGTVTIPADLGEGNYSLGIQFPDKTPVLAENPAYSIQLANAGSWDSQKGQNSLNHIVSVGNGGIGYLPSAPFELDATTVSRTEIDISWKDGSDNETGFEVYRSEGGGNHWEPLVILVPGTETYSDTSAGHGTEYSYIVRALNEYGASAWSDSANAITMGVYTDFPREQFINIYPNPLSDDYLTIQFHDNSIKRVIVRTVLGAQIFSTSTNETSIQLNRDHLQAGIYIITVYHGAHKNDKKFVVL